MKKLFIILLATNLAFITSCKKDDAEPTSVVTTTATSNDVTVANGTRKSGSLPAPSTDPAAPILNPTDETITAISGKNVGFTPQSSGEYTKVLIQIEGQSSYFEVNQSGGTSLRTTSAQNPVLLELPANLAPGTFCFTYCVADSQGRLSNPIKVCVEVTSFGSNDTPNLLGTWKFSSFKDDEGSTYNLSEAMSSESYRYCFNENTFEFDSVIVNSIVNYGRLDFTFQQNGVSIFDYDFSFEDEDYDCDTQLKTVESEVDKGTDKGAWSYNKAKNTLILMFDETTGDDELDYEAVEFTILENTATKLTLVDPFDNYTYYFTK